MRVTLLVIAIALRLTGSPAAHAASPSQTDERIAIVVGANVGSGDDEPLRYAEADARRFRDVMVELGQVRSDNVLLVLGGGPEQVLRALVEVRGRAVEIARSGRQLTVFFYYSGHGDDDALHLPRGRLTLADVRRELASIPATLRLSILDACRGGTGRAKGVHRGPEFALAVSAEAPHGTTELRASSTGEAAQESEELAGAVFTHFLVSGLRGGADTDGDRRVSLSEIYTYVYRRTLLRSATGQALQHPSLALDISGAGDIVVTKPALASAFVQLPAGVDRYVVFSLPSASVVGELSGDRASQLALPAGRFLVTRRSGNAMAVASVDLSWGGIQKLQDKDFRPIAREELVARGGLVELHPWAIEPRLGMEFTPRGPENVALRAGAGLFYSKGALAYELELAFIGGEVRTAGFGGTERSISGGPALAWRSFVGRYTWAVIFGGEFRYSWQHLVRSDAIRVQAAGLPTTERRSTGAMGPKLGFSLLFPLGHQMSATLAASVAGFIEREIDASEKPHFVVQPVVSTTLGIRYAF